MADLVALFTRSMERFVDRVSQVDAGQWSMPTPCTEWDVRALVNHVTYEQLWAPHLLAGETVEQVGDRYDGDVLGAEPLATTRTATGGVGRRLRRDRSRCHRAPVVCRRPLP